MHIAYDLTSETGHPGGIRTYWCALIEQLSRRYPQDRFTLIGSEDLQLPPWVSERENISWQSLGEVGGGALRRRLRQQLLFPLALSGGGFDVVHSVNNILPLTVTLPRVLTVLDCTAWHTPERFSWSKRLFLSKLMPPSVRQAQVVLTISEVTRNDVLRWVPGVDPQKIVVIPLAADEGFSSEISESQRQQVRQSYSLPERYTLFVGAMEPGKNLANMMTAMRRLKQQGSEVPPLVVVGAQGWGGVAESVEEAQDLPIRSLGRVPDEHLAALYAEAELFLFPSLWEGFGLPVLEAFASGTPVITSNCSALPEVAGDAALLVDPHDAWDLAESWLRLWQDRDLRQQLAAAGRVRAREFSWERMALETYQNYKGVLAHPPIVDARQF